MKKFWVTLSICCFLICAVCVIGMVRLNNLESKAQETGEKLEILKDAARESASEKPSETAGTSKHEGGSSSADSVESTDEISTPDTVAENTLDFASLYDVNPDICAWIEIPGTKVDYPILQSPTDDTKYLHTAYDGSEYIGGAIFTEVTYNSNDFNDPVTLIYGHTMRAGTMFGQLQSVYSDSVSFAEHNEIILYLPDEVRRYQVFAAVPYDTKHILYTYDFSNNYWYKNFFKSIGEIRSLDAQFDETVSIEPGDRVIILSTCITGNNSKRFLVMAVLSDDLTK